MSYLLKKDDKRDTTNSKGDVKKITKKPRIREDSPNLTFDTPHRSNKKSDSGNRRNANTVKKEHKMIILDAWAIIKRYGSGTMKKKYRQLIEDLQ